MGMTWQTAEVKKPLAPIGRMCDAGNVAVFTKSGGYVVPQKVLSKTLAALDKIENKSLRMEREGWSTTSSYGSQGRRKVT